jgi:hypothetical protein
MIKDEEVYIITDGCMWEQNKQNSTYYPHAIEVVNYATGQVQFIKSGSKITLVAGQITPTRSQETYNKVPSNGKDKLPRSNIKKGRKKDEVKSL